jgi:hypothetical protein
VVRYISRARADAFPDKFEGAKGSIALEGKYDEYYLEFMRRATRTAPGVKPEGWTDEKIETSARQGLDSLRKAGEWARKTAFINCWYQAEYKSEAPLAPSWFEDLVRDVTSKYHYSFPVKRSVLEDTPFY